MMKELVIKTASELPENATIEEILDAILLNLSIEKGIRDIENGDVISSEELLKEIEEW